MTFRRPSLRPPFLQAVVLLFAVQVAVAQIGGDELETRVDRRVIRLGDPAVLTVSVTLPEGATLDASSAWADTIPRFEWLTAVRADTVTHEGGMRISFSRVFTGFDSGRWTIPSMAFVIDGRVFRSDTVGVEVGTVPLTGDEYRDIGDIFETEETPDSSPRILFIVLVLSVLLGTAAWLHLRLRRGDAGLSSMSGSPEDAFDEAMKSLDLLKDQSLADPRGTKAFHSSLYDVLRGYLGSALGWKVSSLTTGDLLVFLAARCSDREPVARLAACLRLSDAVRFARHSPPAEESRRCVSDIRSFIRYLHENKPGK